MEALLPESTPFFHFTIDQAGSRDSLECLILTENLKVILVISVPRRLRRVIYGARKESVNGRNRLHSSFVHAFHTS